ncbi:hypothetical protein J1N35_026152 [Gossypium stocksii]|uniref:Transposase MuDR plant domain-containing protein n=1 Tax=Gossypium stocksii TaxID=47602 RepID=A0A9D3V802_9ROSI|nr:hypothetical protein J1N35_026152 [Gossypium stocksii]
MFYAGNTYRDMASSSTSGQSTSDFGCTDNYTRRDYILSTTSTNEGTSNPGHAKGVEIEENIELDKDPIRESGSNDLEIALFSELKPVPTEPKDEGLKGEGPNKAIEEAEGGFEFSKLPHRRPGHVSSSLNVGDLEARKEFPSKDALVAAVKQYNIKNGVNFYVVKSWSKIFDMQCETVDVHEKSWLL